MFDPRNNTTDQERVILRKLRVWIAALGLACLVAGIGIGAILSGKPTIAQPDLQIARAPEALSASFAEIARRVEPAVVNIETTQAQPELDEKDEEKEDSTNPLDLFRRPRRPARRSPDARRSAPDSPSGRSRTRRPSSPPPVHARRPPGHRQIFSPNRSSPSSEWMSSSKYGTLSVRSGLEESSLRCSASRPATTW